MSKAEQTKAFIIEKIAPVFNRKGYAGTSLNDMTEVTGLTKGSIYGNFANKDEVALKVFDYNHSTVTNKINAAVAAKANAVDKLLAMASFYSTGCKELFTNGGCPILNTAVEADDSHPLLKKKAADSIKSWKKNIEAIINKGIDKKEIKPSVNAAEFATTFIALIEGGIMMAKATGDMGMLNNSITRINKIIMTELK